MKLIYPYGEDKIYLGRPVELQLDRETGRYIIPANATDIPPEINGEGMWRPLFDEEKQTWVETADEEYKEKLKQGSIPETNPIEEQLATLGQQLADEKLARKQAEPGSKCFRRTIDCGSASKKRSRNFESIFR